MVGSEFCLLRLAVDNHDGVGAQVAFLRRLAQVLLLVPFEQHRIAHLEPSENSRSVGGDGDNVAKAVPVLQFHLIHAGDCEVSA